MFKIITTIQTLINKEKSHLSAAFYICLFSVGLLSQLSANETIFSEPQESKNRSLPRKKWDMAQMSKCFWLSKELKVMVFDSGGATDLSPTKEAFFSIHKVGDVGSTHASFHLGSFFRVISAKVVGSAPNTVLIEVIVEDYADGKEPFKRHYIDATKATRDIENSHKVERNGVGQNVKTSIIFRDTR